MILTASVSTGCATVDLNEVSLPATAPAAAEEVNVVERAVAKLKSAFTNKGFVAKTSRKRMQSAAKILLNGLEAKDVTSNHDGYAMNPKPVSVVLADIEFARRHVVQTTKAAEVYLEMAPQSRNLRRELADLEAALMAAKEAGDVFDIALQGTNEVALTSYIDSVVTLRDVTDEFGARVRAYKSNKTIEAAG